MTTVGISGAAGRLGRVVVQAVRDAPDLELAGLYAPRHAGVVVSAVPCSAEPESLSSADVVVEVTRPDVVMGNLARWRANGSHVVVGTSGFDAVRLSELREMWGSGPSNCLVVPNFSIGAVLMMRFAAEASRYFDGAEIVEMHHAGKVDAPSGTAIATAEAMAGDVPIHSVRLRGLIAHQAVILGSDGQTLTIRHDTTDRSSFVPGVLAAVRGVGGLRGVTVGLEHVLDAPGD
ncbi:MAG: dihydrodipicolinate reductase C-terminal domain-containing protein [Acidimicrobiia bacterium]